MTEDDPRKTEPSVLITESGESSQADFIEIIAEKSNSFSQGKDIEFVSEVRPKYIPAAIRSRFKNQNVQPAQPTKTPKHFRISLQFLLTIAVCVAIGCALEVAIPYAGLFALAFGIPGLIKLAISRQHDDMRDLAGWLAHVITCFVLAAGSVLLGFMAFVAIFIPMGYLESVFLAGLGFEGLPKFSFVIAIGVALFLFVQLMRFLRV